MDSFREKAFLAASEIVGVGNALEIITEAEPTLYFNDNDASERNAKAIARIKKLAERRLKEAQSVSFHAAKEIVSRDDAKDIALEVVIKYIRQQNIDDWKAWIRQSSRNAAINKKKEWNNKHSRFDGLETSVSLSNLATQPDAILLEEERKEIIDETLEWLKRRNEEWYVVFVMTQFEEKSYEECAKELSRSINSIKGIQQRAREAFRRQLIKRKEDLI